MQIIAHVLNIHFLCHLATRNEKLNKMEDFSECLFSLKNPLNAVVEVGNSSFHTLQVVVILGAREETSGTQPHGIADTCTVWNFRNFKNSPGK